MKNYFFYSLSSGKKIKAMTVIVLSLLFMNYSAVFAESLDAYQQPDREISGTVSDENGEPLIGVNVSIKGSTTGTITDANGAFSITAPSDATILFSYIGYNSVEQQVRRGGDLYNYNERRPTAPSGNSGNWIWYPAKSQRYECDK